MDDDKAKPLAWEDVRSLADGGLACDAYCPIGHYIATDAGWFLVWHAEWGRAANLQEAMAGAQADYEARVSRRPGPESSLAPSGKNQEEIGTA